MPHKEMLRLRGYIALAISDAFALAFSFLAANLVYMQDWNSPHGLTMLLSVLPIYLILAAYNQAYSGITLASPRVGIVYAAQTLLWTAAAVLFLAYFLKAGSNFSRIVFSIGIVGGITMICLMRLMLGKRLLKMLGGTPFNTVVIRECVDYTPQPSEIVVTPEEIGFDPETQDPYLYHAFAETIGFADRLIIACQQSRYRLWSNVLKSTSVDGEILTDEDDSLSILGIGRHGDRQTLVVSVEPLHLRQRFLKRLLDLAFASFALIVLAVPMALIAIAIKLESRGPVFFTQERIGRDNLIFRMFKFRSMHIDMCDSAANQLTERDDRRITRMGRFIRATSLDELPQLINVLNGTMSVVGPRPHAISAKAGNMLYWDVDTRYRYRHSIKPGLTGLAQIRGFRGATDHAHDLTNRLVSDLEYMSHWSISRDLWIILRTFAVLRHANAF